MADFGDFNFGDDAPSVDTDPVVEENNDPNGLAEPEDSADGEQNDVQNYPEPGDNDAFQDGDPTSFSVNSNPEEPGAQEDHVPPVVVEPEDTQDTDEFELKEPDLLTAENPEIIIVNALKDEQEDIVPNFDSEPSSESDIERPREASTFEEFLADDELDFLLSMFIDNDDDDKLLSPLDLEDDEDLFDDNTMSGFDEDLLPDDQISDSQGIESLDILDIMDYLESVDLADFQDDAITGSDIIEFQNPDALENYDGLF